MRSVHGRGIGAALHGHGGCQAPCRRPLPWCPPSCVLALGCEFWHGQDRFSSVLPTHTAAPAPPPEPAQLLRDRLMCRQTLKALKKYKKNPTHLPAFRNEKLEGQAGDMYPSPAAQNHLPVTRQAKKKYDTKRST